MKKRPAASRLRTCGIILFWLILWQVCACLIHNNILLVGPLEVIRALAALLGESDFWLSVATSFAKISIGFLIAFLLGIILGWMAFCLPFLQEFLAPVMIFLKSVPVASFVILALIWAGSKNLSVLIAFLVVVPIIYVNTIAGLESTDPKLLEMARVFSIRGWRKIRFLYWPALLPYLTSACRSALGMSWKSGVAAEVIGVPDNTIGEGLYMAKIYLDTAGLFAWTLVIILASGLFERLFLLLLAQTGRRILLFPSLFPGHRKPNTPAAFPSAGKEGGAASASADVPSADSTGQLLIRDLHKSFRDATVLGGLSLTFSPETPWCIMAPSGYGKTTLFRILLGLETADSGKISWIGQTTGAQGRRTGVSPAGCRFSAVFQEDRLCEAFTPIDNVRLAVPSLSRAQIASELAKVLPADCLNRPVSSLSGGMKRRTAILRAMLAPSAVVIMDEPFTGLDEETKSMVIDYILKKTGHRLLLLSTHQEEDARLLNAKTLRLQSETSVPTGGKSPEDADEKKPQTGSHFPSFP